VDTLKIISAVAYEQHPVLSVPDTASCRLPAGFRFLVTDGMEIVEPVLLFLFDRYAHGSKPWSKVSLSETAACDDLYEWWSYINLIGLHWRDVVTDDIFGYRKALETATSPRTLQRYKTNTIRRRLSTILSFYKWALAEKYTDEVVDRRRLIGAIRSTDGSMLAHVDNSLGKTEASDILPSEEDTEPSPFHNTKELQAVLRALGPLPSERADDSRPARDRLAATTALVTGARISEVLNIPLSEILGLRRPPGDEPTSSLVMWLRKTKRMRPRKVLMPVWLLDELTLYIDGERADAVAKTADLGRSPDPNLFLNGTAANNRDVGHALTRRSLSGTFWNAVVSVGFCTVIEADREHDLPRRIIARHSFHDLRHTFAVQQYLARKAKGDAEPWKVISVLLGHKSWKTTMDYYLASVSIAEAQLSDTMTGYFRGILSLGGVSDAA
jgi:integrase/recombinase XerC